MQCVTQVSPKAVQKARSLIALNTDSAQGLREAAEKAVNPAVARTLSICADTRREFASELQLVLRAMGEDPARMPGGAMPAWWRSLDTLAQRGGDRAVLNEALRGEACLRARYDEAVKETPGDLLAEVLERQYISTRRVEDRIRALRDATAYV